jgi:hypothetical protein
VTESAATDALRRATPSRAHACRGCSASCLTTGVATKRPALGDIAQTASHLQLSRGLVQAAVAYYGAFVSEIDDWIERNEHEATRAHDA